MGHVTKIECRWCGRMTSLRMLKAQHGKNAPFCVARRTQQRLDEIGWRFAGQFGALLSKAGIAKMAPAYVWWREPVYREEEVEEGSRSRGFRMVTRRVLDHWGDVQESLTFEATCPVWAWEMAKRLTRDKQLARRLGYVQKRQLVSQTISTRTSKGQTPRTERVWRECDIDKLLPVHVRVKILRVAATNEIARELIIDDPEAAAVIIRDTWGVL